MSDKKWKCTRVENIEAPQAPGSVRLLCFSDTHSLHNDIPKEWISPADIALFGGDFSNVGSMEDVVSFRDFIHQLPCKHKVVVAGNHELSFDEENRNDIIGRMPRNSQDPNLIKAVIKDDPEIIYLEGSPVCLEGINIYGTPYSPFFYNWAFPTFNEEKGLRWEKIPEETDVLLVHGPPHEILDMTTRGVNAGSFYLAERIKKVKPLLCIFGHIHEAYGFVEKNNILYANVSTVNIQYRVTNPLMYFDMIRL